MLVAPGAVDSQGDSIAATGRARKAAALIPGAVRYHAPCGKGERCAS
jgi:hypothetical protein